MKGKISLIIGIVLFILIIGATYSKTMITSNNNFNEITTEEKIEELIYKGYFPIPVENFIKVTSGFGIREGSQIVSTNHHGIDLVGSRNSRIISVMDGEVTYSGWQSGYGNCVEIKHTNENGEIFYTFYAHMQDDSLNVIKGQKITVGQVLGVQGTTGNSTGDHLHFEIRLDNKTRINPAPYLFGKMEE